MTEDEAVTRLAAAMNCPSKDGATCTACHANARRVIDALRADPEFAAAALGGDVRDHTFGVRAEHTVFEYDRLTFAELAADDGGTVVTAPIIRGPWREVPPGWI